VSFYPWAPLAIGAIGPHGANGGWFGMVVGIDPMGPMGPSGPSHGANGANGGWLVWWLGSIPWGHQSHGAIGAYRPMVGPLDWPLAYRCHPYHPTTTNLASI